MTKSMKAGLFSAFIFPGSGHFYLRQHVQGILLATISGGCLIALLSIAVDKAQQISDKILAGEIPLDATRIAEEVTKQAAVGGTQLADISTWMLLVCWLVGIVDSYRVGRIRDKADRSREHRT